MTHDRMVPPKSVASVGRSRSCGSDGGTRLHHRIRRNTRGRHRGYRISGADQRVQQQPPSTMPDEPVMFCVHDAQRGEVSILHGSNEVIVRDRQLVARILTAAGSARV